MKTINIDVKLLNKNAHIPTKGSEYAAGSDLYAKLENDEIIIKPHETVKIKTGIAIKIPDGYVGLIYARSGKSINEDLAPANKVGVIDSDYRGEIIVAIHNHGEIERTVMNNERIAQIVFTEYSTPTFNLVNELDNTERGDGGFGSSGKQ